MDFFVTLVNGTKPLIQVTNNSVLTVTEVIDMSLLFSLNLAKVNKRCSLKKLLKMHLECH